MQVTVSQNYWSNNEFVDIVLIVKFSILVHKLEEDAVSFFNVIQQKLSVFIDAWNMCIEDQFSFVIVFDAPSIHISIHKNDRITS